MALRLLAVPTSRTSTALAPGSAAVAQQIGGAVVVHRQKVEVAVVVDVCRRQRAADPLGREAGTGPGGDVAEAAAVVAQQHAALRLFGAGPHMPRAVHHVAVDDREIEVAVVVGVEKQRAEADERQCGGADAGLERDVLEQAAPRLRKRCAPRTRGW
jgi:hypothetical protein